MNASGKRPSDGSLSLRNSTDVPELIERLNSVRALLEGEEREDLSPFVDDIDLLLAQVKSMTRRTENVDLLLDLERLGTGIQRIQHRVGPHAPPRARRELERAGYLVNDLVVLVVDSTSNERAWNDAVLTRVKESASPRELSIFASVAGAGNFEIASRRLDRPPSEVSRTMLRFQTSAGVRLFESDSGGVLNPAGRALAALLGVPQKAPVRPPIEDVIERVREITPEQRVGPVKFDVVRGMLMVAPQDNRTASGDERAAEAARTVLIESGRRLLTELKSSNCDRRVVETVEVLQGKLESKQDVIELAVMNLGCDTMRATFECELPDAIVALMKSYSTGIGMYAAQFPEWARFVENAASVDLEPADIRLVHDATARLVAELRASPQVDADVPAKLTKLNSLIAKPVDASKKVFFAVVRTLSNLVARVFKHAADLLEAIGKGAVEGAEKGASQAFQKIVKWGLIALALRVAVELNPMVGKMADMNWLPTAVQTMKRDFKPFGLEGV